MELRQILEGKCIEIFKNSDTKLCNERYEQLGKTHWWMRYSHKSNYHKRWGRTPGGVSNFLCINKFFIVCFQMLEVTPFTSLWLTGKVRLPIVVISGLQLQQLNWYPNARTSFWLETLTKSELLENVLIIGQFDATSTLKFNMFWGMIELDSIRGFFTWSKKNEAQNTHETRMHLW